jgi:hypothetical protein
MIQRIVERSPFVKEVRKKSISPENGISPEKEFV